MRYKLFDAKWKPLLCCGGQNERIGCEQVLVEAYCVRQIAASNPMDNAPRFCILLSMAVWCKQRNGGVAIFQMKR